MNDNLAMADADCTSAAQPGTLKATSGSAALKRWHCGGGLPLRGLYREWWSGAGLAVDRSTRRLAGVSEGHGLR